MTELPEASDPVVHSEQTSSVPIEAGIFGRVIDRIGTVFAVGFLLSMAVLMYEIFMRHLFNAPTLWAHETTTFLCASGFIFGGLYCAVHNKHIRVVPVYDAVSPEARRWLDVVIYVICAISTGFFSVAAWRGVERSVFAPGGRFRLETSGSAWNPPIPALLKVFLFIVLVSLTIQFIIFAIAHLRQKASQ